MSWIDLLLTGFNKRCDIKINLGQQKTVAQRNRWLRRIGEKKQSGTDACSGGKWEQGLEILDVST